MAAGKRSDPKLEALRKSGTLNSRATRVVDETFRSNEFFDGRDLVQVKYEMLRRVRVEQAPVANSARAFGFSRPTFYQAQAALERAGLAGLVPRKPGRRSAHKLTTQVMSYVQEARASGPQPIAALVQRIRQRFGVMVHRRSLERALRRVEKKQP